MHTMSTQTHDELELGIEPFEHEAKTVLLNLRTALAELLAELPGSIASAADLARTLKVDRNISWNIHKSSISPNPLDAGTHIPEPASMKRFLSAASRNGATPQIIKQVQKAADDFQTLVKVHAGDRATFNSMVSAFGSDTGFAGSDLAHKRAAFRANRHLWGVHAKTRFNTFIIQPSKDPNWLDLAAMHGFIDLQKINPESTSVISRISTTFEQPQSEDGEQYERIPLSDSGHTEHGLSLIPEFCSDPLPTLCSTIYPSFIQAEVESKGVGRLGRITCVEGSYLEHIAPRYKQRDDLYARHAVANQIPCEYLFIDLLLRSDTYPGVNPEVVVHGDGLLNSNYPLSAHDRPALPVKESVVYLGKGSSVMHTPQNPNSAAMTQYAFDRMGWNGDDFDVYRCCIQYPIMPTITVVRFKLPEHP